MKTISIFILLCFSVLSFAKVDPIFDDGFENPPPCVSPYPNAQVQDWDTAFNVWPAFGYRIRVFVPLDGYLSYRFTATNVAGQFGTFATGDFPGDGDGIGVMSISSAPGCFDPARLPVNCVTPPSRYVGIGWANGSTLYSCSLNPGQTYYLNFTYGNTTNTGGAVCASGLCGADVQNQIQF